MRPPNLDETFSEEAIEQLIKQGEMTVPFTYEGLDMGMVTAIADEIGLKVVNVSSQDAAMRNMVIGMYIYRF
jgi:hypothetical protein